MIHPPDYNSKRLHTLIFECRRHVFQGTLWWFFYAWDFFGVKLRRNKVEISMLFYAKISKTLWHGYTIWHNRVYSACIFVWIDPNTYSFLVFLPKLGGSTNLLLLVLDHSLSQSENVLTSRPGSFESWLTLGKSLAVNKRSLLRCQLALCNKNIKRRQSAIKN